MVEKQIVKAESKAFGYNYASLADIVAQGFKLPVMETRNIDGETFMGWLDDKEEWHQGAPLIVPEMKGMNAAQAMGSALTYARRYTAQMALGLACDDDVKLEKTIKQVKEEIKALNSIDELNNYWRELKPSKKQAEVLKPIFSERKVQIGVGA